MKKDIYTKLRGYCKKKKEIILSYEFVTSSMKIKKYIRHNRFGDFLIRAY